MSNLTPVERSDGYGRIKVKMMEERIDMLVTAAVAVGVAGYFALFLEHVAHVGFGFSAAQIRDAAMFAAILLTMPTAIGLLGRSRDRDAEG